MQPAPPAMRVDKWLWHARFFKTRALASGCVAGGHLRLNGTRVTKPAQPVRPGDVLTFAAGGTVRVVRITALSARRGPAPEARTLYEEIGAPPAADPGAPQAHPGRPSREDRRTGRLGKGGLLE